MNPALARLAARQHGAVHRRQFVREGINHRTLRSWLKAGRVESLSTDVFAMTGSPSTWDRRLWTGFLEAGGRAAVSHRSAAAVLGLPGFGPGPVDILEPENTHHRGVLGARHRTSWLPPEHVRVINHLRVTSLARTLFDLAGLSSPTRRRHDLPYVHEGRVERAVDNALSQMGLPVDRLADVVAVLGRRGRPGTALMRRLLAERGEGYVATESVLEDLLRAVLAAHGLPPPDRQVVLGADLPVGRVDFVYPAARLVIEADSRRHHSSLLDAEHDRWRDLELTAAGWRVIRVSWWQLVNEPERFVSALRRALDAATA